MGSETNILSALFGSETVIPKGNQLHKEFFNCSGCSFHSKKTASSSFYCDLIACVACFTQ